MFFLGDWKVVVVVIHDSHGTFPLRWWRADRAPTPAPTVTPVRRLSRGSRRLSAAAYCCRDVFIVLDDSHEKVGRQTLSPPPPPPFGSSSNEKCHPEVLLGQAPGERMTSSEHFLLYLWRHVLGMYGKVS